MSDDKDQKKDAEKDAKVTSPTAEQEIRNAKQRAEAEEQGGGPRQPQEGLNQDG